MRICQTRLFQMQNSAVFLIPYVNKFYIQYEKNKKLTDKQTGREREKQRSKIIKACLPQYTIYNKIMGNQHIHTNPSPSLPPFPFPANLPLASPPKDKEASPPLLGAAHQDIGGVLRDSQPPHDCRCH